MNNECPNFLPEYVWIDYLKSEGSNRESITKLIFSDGMDSAWREITKKANNADVVTGIFRGIISIFQEKEEIESKESYQDDMKKLSKISRDAAFLLDSIERKYNKDFLRDFQLFHYANPDPRCFERNPDFTKIKPYNKKIKFSEYLRFISGTARELSREDAIAWYLTMDVKKNNGNAKQVYVIRKIAVLFKLGLGAVMYGTCAKFASVILHESISIDQVKNALRRFNGIKS